LKAASINKIFPGDLHKGPDLIKPHSENQVKRSVSFEMLKYIKTTKHEMWVFCDIALVYKCVVSDVRHPQKHHV